MILAQAAAVAADTSSGSGLLWLLGGLSACGGVGGVVGLIGLFATKREVEMRTKVLEDRVGQAEETLEGIRRELGEMERRLNKGSEDRAKETHDRINQILEGLADLRGRFNQDHNR